jgi:hypothetical protein
MMDSLQTELHALIDEIAPPLIDSRWLDNTGQLERLVREDEAAELFDGECLVHDGCQSVSQRP